LLYAILITFIIDVVLIPAPLKSRSSTSGWTHEIIEKTRSLACAKGIHLWESMSRLELQKIVEVVTWSLNMLWKTQHEFKRDSKLNSMRVTIVVEMYMVGFKWRLL